MTLVDRLDLLRVDWADFGKAGEVTRELAMELAHDQAALGTLVRRIEHEPGLMAMCEKHPKLEYLVLYDAVDRGFRIRLHLSTDDPTDGPHDHRFSFSTCIVTGGYEHTLYRVDGDERQPGDEAGLVESMVPYATRFEGPGDCYTLEHTAVHTTFMRPDTVTVFVRGSAEKDRSLLTDTLSGRVWWSFGRQDESIDRRAQTQMSDDDYRHTCHRLERLGAI